MGFVDNFKNVANSMQQRVTRTSSTLAQRLLRLSSGLIVAVVLSLIIQEFSQNGTLMFIFFTVFFTLLLYRLLRSFSIFQIFIFDVICVLIATLLRLYIMLAP